MGCRQSIVRHPHPGSFAEIRLPNLYGSYRYMNASNKVFLGMTTPRIISIYLYSSVTNERKVSIQKAIPEKS